MNPLNPWLIKLGGGLFPGFPAPPAGHQINVSARIEQRIGRGLDTFNARNRIEDDSLLFAGIVRDNGCQRDLSERDQLTAFRPADGRIVRDVAIL